MSASPGGLRAGGGLEATRRLEMHNCPRFSSPALKLKYNFGQRAGNPDYTIKASEAHRVVQALLRKSMGEECALKNKAGTRRTLNRARQDFKHIVQNGEIESSRNKATQSGRNVWDVVRISQTTQITNHHFFPSPQFK